MNKKNEEIVKKRDLIVKKICLVNNEETEAKACAILDRFLVEKHKNKTPERAFILSLIYKLNIPADIETIHRLVEEQYGHVSPTTVYYTLQLLTEAKLVRRIELIENGPAFFEKTLDTIPHGYTVCRHCGTIMLFPLENIRKDASMHAASGFHIDDVSLIIRGSCWSCARKMAKEKSSLKKTNTAKTTKKQTKTN